MVNPSIAAFGAPARLSGCSVQELFGVVTIKEELTTSVLVLLEFVGAVVALVATGAEVGAVAFPEEVLFVVNTVAVEFSIVGANVSGFVPLFSGIVEGADVVTGRILGASVEMGTDGSG